MGQLYAQDLSPEEKQILRDLEVAASGGFSSEGATSPSVGGLQGGSHGGSVGKAGGNLSGISEGLLSEKRIPRTYSSFKTRYPAIALTFDDGPHPIYTPKLLDILAQYGVRATFFLIGANVQKYPEIAQRIVAEGHQVANHTMSHPDLTKLKKKKVMYEVGQASTIIEAYTGSQPLCVRPPYGSLNKKTEDLLYSSSPMDIVFWTVDPEDWKKPGADVIAQRLIDGARPGAILLAHDIHAQTIEAVPLVISRLKAMGYRFGTISQLNALPDQVHANSEAGGGSKPQVNRVEREETPPTVRRAQAVGDGGVGEPLVNAYTVPVLPAVPAR
jgi:peptidoglycan/xylan/chitin deacetylase (PgdA/CDA1 family)